MVVEDFTLGGYLWRLNAILNSGYSVSGDFSDLKSSHRVFLRHDVDLSLGAALKVAYLEHKIGVNSTYFILLTSDFYNPMSQQGRQHLREIVRLGHSIGLHFDKKPWSDATSRTLVEAVRRQARILEDLALAPVKFFSHHQPGKNGYFATEDLEIFDVYQQVADSRLPYFSDSTGTFRFGDYSATMESGKSFQLLTHPIWWSPEKGEHPKETMQHFLDSLGRQQLSQLGKTISKFDFPLGSEFGWLPGIEREVLSQQ